MDKEIQVILKSRPDYHSELQSGRIDTAKIEFKKSKFDELVKRDNMM